jgi:hypothetical protein
MQATLSATTPEDGTMNEWRLLETMRGRRVGGDSPRKACEGVGEHGDTFQRALCLLGLTEPRACPRFPCRQRVYYRSVNLYDATVGTGSVINVSRVGVRLLTREPFAPGQFLTLEFPELAAAFPKLVRMKVVHLAAASRTSFYVGGTWLPELTRAQLESLLPTSCLLS